MRTTAEARFVRDDNAWLRLPRPEQVDPGQAAEDIDGTVFRITASTSTEHGFPVLRGRPSGQGGTSSIILTDDLALHLERHRLTPGRLRLPISDRMVLMLRRRLSFNSWVKKREWWEAHRDELASSDIESKGRWRPSAASILQPWLPCVSVCAGFDVRRNRHGLMMEPRHCFSPIDHAPSYRQSSDLRRSTFPAKETSQIEAEIVHT